MAGDGKFMGIGAAPGGGCGAWGACRLGHVLPCFLITSHTSRLLQIRAFQQQFEKLWAMFR